MFLPNFKEFPQGVPEMLDGCMDRQSINTMPLATAMASVEA